MFVCVQDVCVYDKENGTTRYQFRLRIVLPVSLEVQPSMQMETSVQPGMVQLNSSSL